LAGIGVYGNDDDGDSFATLPAGDANSPTVAGLYLLAISGHDKDPIDAVNTRVLVEATIGPDLSDFCVKACYTGSRGGFRRFA